MTCKTCKWLDVKPDKSGRIVVRDTGYKCVVPLPELPVFPDSITKQYQYRHLFERRFDASWTFPKMGATCPLHEPRKP